MSAVSPSSVLSAPAEPLLRRKEVAAFVQSAKKNHSYALSMMRQLTPNPWEKSFSSKGISTGFLAIAELAAEVSNRPEEVRCMSQFLQWTCRYLSKLGEQRGVSERFVPQLRKIRSVLERIIPRQHDLVLEDFRWIILSSVNRGQYPAAYQGILKIQQMIFQTTDQFGLHQKILKTAQELQELLSGYWEIPETPWIPPQLEEAPDSKEEQNA